MKKIFVPIFWLLLANVYLAQQPILKLDSVKSLSGDSIVVNLYAENLTDIGALTIKITIDTTALSWGRAMNWDNQLDGALAGFVNNQIILAWDGLNGMNLANGKLVELKLLYKGNTSLFVFDTTKTELANLEGSIVKVNFINGSVSPLTDLYENISNDIPRDYLLAQNFPNPFNPTTTIRYSLPFDSKVVIKINNVLGQDVKLLKDEIVSAGNYEVQFNSASLPSGIYFYRLSAESVDGKQKYSSIKKMILLK
ncbi:MAG: T9SS type A sorting domain-containing protein [Ignavibacteriaceae bacterium]|jgi:hypothetical protein